MTLKYIITTLVVSLTIVSCITKPSPNDILINNISVPDSNFSDLPIPHFVINKESPIEGTWEMRSGFSGWGGEYKCSAGNGNTYTFSKSRYVEYANHVLFESGTYEIHQDSVAYLDNRQKFNCIVLKNELSRSLDGQVSSPKHISIELANNNLVFTYLGCYDIGPSLYVRIK